VLRYTDFPLRAALARPILSTQRGARSTDLRRHASLKWHFQDYPSEPPLQSGTMRPTAAIANNRVPAAMG
jgi:hypothetical protein